MARSVSARTRSQILSTPTESSSPREALRAARPTVLKLPGSKRRASGDRVKSYVSKSKRFLTECQPRTTGSIISRTSADR